MNLNAPAIHSSLWRLTSDSVQFQRTIKSMGSALESWWVTHSHPWHVLYLSSVKLMLRWFSSVKVLQRCHFVSQSVYLWPRIVEWVGHSEDPPTGPDSSVGSPPPPCGQSSAFCSEVFAAVLSGLSVKRKPDTKAAGSATSSLRFLQTVNGSEPRRVSSITSLRGRSHALLCVWFQASLFPRIFMRHDAAARRANKSFLSTW